MDTLENTEQQTQAETEVGLTDQAVSDTGGDSGASTAQSMPDFEIKHNGQVVKIPYAQASEYLSKGYDYTAKTQELARERDTLKPYQELATYLQSNPDKAQAVYNSLQGGDVDPVQQKIAQHETVINQLIQQNSKQQLDNMLAQIHSDEKYEGLFKDSDMEELLLANALQTGKTNLDGLRGVADKIHNKVLKFRVDAEKAGEKKVVQSLASPTRKSESGAGTFNPPKGFDPAKASWRELSQRAQELL